MSIDYALQITSSIISLLLLLTLLPHSHRGNARSPHIAIVIAKTPPPQTLHLAVTTVLYFQDRCLFTQRVWYMSAECSPSGSQSFFSARHMGALIRRFLPLERTVVALVKKRGAGVFIEGHILLKIKNCIHDNPRWIHVNSFFVLFNIFTLFSQFYCWLTLVG